jgi:hypothetical protein
VKHAELYAAAIKLLTETSTALSQQNLDEQKALVEKHIEMEAELDQEVGEDDANHRERQGQNSF